MRDIKAIAPTTDDTTITIVLSAKKNISYHSIITAIAKYMQMKYLR